MWEYSNIENSLVNACTYIGITRIEEGTTERENMTVHIATVMRANEGARSLYQVARTSTHTHTYARFSLYIYTHTCVCTSMDVVSIWNQPLLHVWFPSTRQRRSWNEFVMCLKRKCSGTSASKRCSSAFLLEHTHTHTRPLLVVVSLYSRLPIYQKEEEETVRSSRAQGLLGTRGKIKMRKKTRGAERGVEIR